MRNETPSVKKFTDDFEATSAITAESVKDEASEPDALARQACESIVRDRAEDTREQFAAQSDSVESAVDDIASTHSYLPCAKDYKPHIMMAWVTLLTQPNYVAGVRTLRASLESSGSVYPLVVLVTDEINAQDRQLLQEEGCLLRSVEPLSPGNDLQDSYAIARFAEVWTKLTAWRLTEFERVVFLDADMLVTQNMDELFSLALAAGDIAACHACRCNPNNIASYPVSWKPENCFYSHCSDDFHTRETGVVDSYLNAGLLVLTPDESVYLHMVSELRKMTDLSRYPFAEQDFLNDYYRNRWQPLPYIYNALKTLRFQHPSLWNVSDVKNIHYIIDKPWEKALDSDDSYYEVNKLWWDTATQASTGPFVSVR